MVFQSYVTSVLVLVLILGTMIPSVVSGEREGGLADEILRLLQEEESQLAQEFCNVFLREMDKHLVIPEPELAIMSSVYSICSCLVGGPASSSSVGVWSSPGYASYAGSSLDISHGPVSSCADSSAGPTKLKTFLGSTGKPVGCHEPWLPVPTTLRTTRGLDSNPGNSTSLHISSRTTYPASPPTEFSSTISILSTGWLSSPSFVVTSTTSTSAASSIQDCTRPSSSWLMISLVPCTSSTASSTIFSIEPSSSSSLASSSSPNSITSTDSSISALIPPTDSSTTTQVPTSFATYLYTPSSSSNSSSQLNSMAWTTSPTDSTVDILTSSSSYTSSRNSSIEIFTTTSTHSKLTSSTLSWIPSLTTSTPQCSSIGDLISNGNFSSIDLNTGNPDSWLLSPPTSSLDQSTNVLIGTDNTTSPPTNHLTLSISTSNSKAGKTGKTSITQSIPPLCSGTTYTLIFESQLSIHDANPSAACSVRFNLDDKRLVRIGIGPGGPAGDPAPLVGKVKRSFVFVYLGGGGGYDDGDGARSDEMKMEKGIGGNRLVLSLECEKTTAEYLIWAIGLVGGGLDN